MEKFLNETLEAHITTKTLIFKESFNCDSDMLPEQECIMPEISKTFEKSKTMTTTSTFRFQGLTSFTTHSGDISFTTNSDGYPMFVFGDTSFEERFRLEKTNTTISYRSYPKNESQTITVPVQTVKVENNSRCTLERNFYNITDKFYVLADIELNRMSDVSLSSLLTFLTISFDPHKFKNLKPGTTDHLLALLQRPTTLMADDIIELHQRELPPPGPKDIHFVFENGKFYLKNLPFILTANSFKAEVNINKQIIF